MRLALGSDSSRLVVCGLLSTCETWCEKLSTARVAVEIQFGALEESLNWIARLDEHCPGVKSVALLPAGSSVDADQELEAALLEAGAAAVFHSPLEAGRIVDWARRSFDRATAPTVGLAQQVWAELPWSEAAR
jgi:hypothetical protein